MLSVQILSIGQGGAGECRVLGGGMRYETGPAYADGNLLREPPRGVDPDWISATIGMIYDCVMAPDRWAATIETIARHLSFSTVVLGLIEMRDVPLHRAIVHRGLDTEWLGSWAPYAEALFALWGGRKRFTAYPFDELILASEVSPQPRAMENAYYRDILAPRGLHEGVFVTLAREGELLGYLCVNRHDAAGPIRPWERDSLRLLTPHLRRALTISHLFDIQAVEQQTFRSILDAMRHAVILVDERAGIVHANKAAETMLADAGEIATLEGRLRLASQPAQEALEAALLLAARDEVQLAQRGIGIPVRAQDGSPMLLHAFPLHRRKQWRGVTQRAVAAIFIAPTTQPPDPPIDAVSLLYDLTPAETQIFSIVAKGRTVDEAARAMAIAKNTARTHLQHVFDKTGCNRQAELVALAAQLRAPI